MRVVMLILFVNLLIQMYIIANGSKDILYPIFGAITVLDLFIYACFIDEERNEKH